MIFFYDETKKEKIIFKNFFFLLCFSRMNYDVSNNRNGYKIEMKEIKYNSTSQKSINSLMKKMMKDSSHFWKMVLLENGKISHENYKHIMFKIKM